MKKFASIILLLIFSLPIIAQERKIEAESAVVTQHTATINGQRVPFKATAGTMPVWNDAGQPVATLFYVFYERTDVRNKDERPIVFSFNGGPGSASVWMHMAYTGPFYLRIDSEGYPLQPYGYVPNPHSILDVADIVFVDPVNTGYSRILDSEATHQQFFGVNQDVRYLSEWIQAFVTRSNRWLSPKYLIGESYGTTRVSGLALALQGSGMYLNGVVLVSPTNLGIDRNGPVNAANRLPYFSAVAWYHNKLAPELQAKSLETLLDEVETYSINELLPAITKGAWATEEERSRAISQFGRYSGLSEQSVAGFNLNVPTSFFWKDLLRDEGFTVGRLDSRYKGIDRNDAGISPDYNAEMASWMHSFTPAINHYLRNVLKYQTDVKYNIFGPVRPWDNEGDRSGENLRQAMAQNPFLHTLIQAGYFDGATTYFNAKYTMWHLDPGGKLKDRLSFKGYESGHMMYLRAEDLQTSNNDLREFIKKTIPAKDQPARY